MPPLRRYVAFLRAINVGGHVVKMDRLRTLFEGLGFANVSTFIASGNVVFDSTATDTRPIPRSVQRSLSCAPRRMSFASTAVSSTGSLATDSAKREVRGRRIAAHRGASTSAWNST
jgi:hypothetical protein